MCTDKRHVWAGRDLGQPADIRLKGLGILNTFGDPRLRAPIPICNDHGIEVRGSDGLDHGTAGSQHGRGLGGFGNIAVAGR
ncbi:hypothetical protein RRF57_009277 [Xylaria bambusicola]|uniref:Uncharacterized protein n=1 Tax=Xylaria bambusicola TaxID=326684 RepID=A0AAN7ZBV4_9PEZI